MEEKIIEKTADKLIANCYNGNLKLRFENVDKIEAVLNKSNSHPHNFSFYADLLNGCLINVFYTYCNFQKETITGSLINVDVDFTNYNKCLKDFTVQLLKLLNERTEKKEGIKMNGLKIIPIDFKDYQGKQPLTLKDLDKDKMSQEEQEKIINKLAYFVSELQLDGGSHTGDCQAIASLIPIYDLKGFLGNMYYIYCDWQNVKASLITVKVSDYNKKGDKEFTIQLLNILNERTENEKKVTNNE